MNLQALNLSPMPGNSRLNSDMNVNTAGLTRRETKKMSRERRASFGQERAWVDSPPTDFAALANAYGLNKPPAMQQHQPPMQPHQVPPTPPGVSRGVRLSDDGPTPLPNVAATPTRGVRLSDDGPIPPANVSRGVRLTDNPVPPIQIRPPENPIPVPPRSALRPASQAISREDSIGSFERLRYSTASTETDEHSNYVLPPRMRALEPPIPARALDQPLPIRALGPPMPLQPMELSIPPRAQYDPGPASAPAIPPAPSPGAPKGVRLVDPGNGHVPRRGSESSSVKPVVRPRRPSETGAILPRVAPGPGPGFSGGPGFGASPGFSGGPGFGFNRPAAPVAPLDLSSVPSAPFRRADDHDPAKGPASPTRHTMTLNALLGNSANSSPVNSAFSNLTGSRSPPPMPKVPPPPAPQPAPAPVEDKMEVVDDTPAAPKRTEGPAPVRPMRSARRTQQGSISGFSAISAVSAVSQNSNTSSRSRGGYI